MRPDRVRSCKSSLIARVAKAQRAANVLGDGTHPAAPASAVPDRNTFWMTAKGAVLRAGESDDAVIRALASEWASTDAAARAAQTPSFGPVRYGSQWSSQPGAHRVTVATVPRPLRAVGGLPGSGRAGWCGGVSDDW